MHPFRIQILPQPLQRELTSVIMRLRFIELVVLLKWGANRQIFFVSHALGHNIIFILFTLLVLVTTNKIGGASLPIMKFFLLLLLLLLLLFVFAYVIVYTLN